MMTNLFSMFDPSTSGQTSMNWVSTAMFLMFLTPSFWIISTKMSSIINKMKELLCSELMAILGVNSQKGSLVIFISLFVFILTNNFFGVYPHIFVSTSHLNITLSLALPFWLGVMMFGWMNNTKQMLSNLVPCGTPKLLMPFMVVIESISNLIRPGSLAIRLTANMIAGHVLMALLANHTAEMCSMWVITALIIVQMILITLESAVAIIQAYVFTILMTLYSTEINSH